LAEGVKDAEVGKRGDAGGKVEAMVESGMKRAVKEISELQTGEERIAE